MFGYSCDAIKEKNKCIIEINAIKTKQFTNQATLVLFSTVYLLRNYIFEKKNDSRVKAVFV